MVSSAWSVTEAAREEADDEGGDFLRAFGVEPTHRRREASARQPCS